MAAAVSSEDPKTISNDRLEGQIVWYDAKAKRNQRNYRVASVVEIGISAAIMIVASLPSPVTYRSVSLAAVLAAVLAIMKGMETAYQWQSNWINYRAAAEALKHEKYLYYGKAGPYADAPNPDRLLVERVEDVILHENGGWTGRMQPAQAAQSPADTQPKPAE
jgi:Protein of unknown function (DUF4231)